ncbi:MAG: type II toxin-antitoxin system RelE/ParE family toxin [Nitrospirae bacterium]|nr:type II toxin-antitoxin system RelE/ParE family toxin [Nitrospirota bacterium]
MSPNRYSVRLLPIAEQDLEEIIDYIAADRPTAAYELADRIEKNLQRLASHPHLGKIPDDEKLSGMGYRFLIIEDYLIFYTVRARTVLIHRIIHGARNIQDLL